MGSSTVRYLETRHIQNGGQHRGFFHLSVVTVIKNFAVICVIVFEMTAKSVSSNGNASAAENTEEIPFENANVEKTDPGKSEALPDQNENVVKSQAGGEINPPENAILQMEEDQVIGDTHFL